MSSFHVHYEYENGSSNTIHPTSVTYPDGRVLTYNYGTAGGMNDRLSRVESLGFDGTYNLVQPAYLGLGTQAKTTHSEPAVRWDLATGNSPNPYAGLDRFGRVIDNKRTNYSSSTTLDQIKYTYDRASNRTSRENVVAKAQTTPKYFDELYGYDGSNRLSLMERGQLAGSPPSSITNKQFAQDWGLDPTGNWKVFKEDANGDGTWDLNQTRTSNPVNEITAINETAGPSWVTPGYDSAGNMTTIPRPAEPTGDYTGVYDAWNRLVELRGLDDTVVGRYEYDGLTRRVVKHTFPGWEELEAADWDAMTEEDWNGLQLTQAHRRDYYYNAAWQILEERVENDTAFDRQYVWGLRYIDELVFRDRQLTSSVERNYALQDANWNVTTLTDDNGAVVERYSYSAYGAPSFLNPDFTSAANNEAYDWDVLYAGYKWDAESALYQVRFRYLQPSLGGWVTRDPLGYKDGTNNRAYTKSRPLINTDLFGLAVSDIEKRTLKAGECNCELINLTAKYKNAQEMIDAYDARNKQGIGTAAAFNVCIDGKLKPVIVARDATANKNAKDECGIWECTTIHEQHHIDQSEFMCKDKADCSKLDGCHALALRCKPGFPYYNECFANAINLECLIKKGLAFKNKKEDKCYKMVMEGIYQAVQNMTDPILSNYNCISDKNILKNDPYKIDLLYFSDANVYASIIPDLIEFEKTIPNLLIPTM